MIEYLLRMYFENGIVGWLGLTLTLMVIYVAFRIVPYLALITGIIIIVIGVSGALLSFFLEDVPWDWRYFAFFSIFGALLIKVFASGYSGNLVDNGDSGDMMGDWGDLSD